jgi:UDP-N-acetylglucosamine transferase subunit ALG13
MIFVTVGNHFQGFERLLKKVDEIAPRIPHEMLIQKGFSKYVPHHTEYFDFVPLKMAVEYIRKSDLVISHAGMGTIILCKGYGIPIIIFPRREKYKEHVNDHQMEIAQVLEERRDVNIRVVYEEGELENKMSELLKSRVRYSPQENVGKINLIRTIRAFIQENER